MTQQTSPFVEGKYGWSLGESGWNIGMDENLLKFSFLFDRTIDSIVSSLPAAVNGHAYFLTTDSRLYFVVGGLYYSSPTPKWFVVTLKTTGQTYQFNGTALVAVANNAALDTRLTSAEGTISTLGTAAFAAASSFAAESELAIVAANAGNYTDALRADLLDPTKGAKILSTKHGYTGAITQTQDVVNKAFVSVEAFGAIGDGVADDTAAIQLALDSGAKRIVFRASKTYNITAVTASGDNTGLILESGCTIAAQTPTARAITIAGNNCSITGPGTILGKPVFDGANVTPTYALVWVTGNNLTVKAITVDTIPKEGIMFSNSTGHTVEGCRFYGRYPYASYDENTTTNQCAIMSDIPPLATEPEPNLLIVGNYIESCIQGCLLANYGAAANNTGNTITGNTFRHCWDHGVYMSRGVGHTITGNTFLSCRRPIVSDGIGSTVVGNTLYSALAVGIKYAEQLISVREAANCVIANNTIYGVDAAIYVDCIETVVQTGNIIEGNSLFATGTNFATAMIRVGVGATTCEQNVVRGNNLNTGSLAAANAMIQVTMLSGFGRGNEVSDNTLVRTIPGHGISINRNGYSVTKNNRVDISGTSAGAVTVQAIAVDNSTFPVISGNDLYYTSGGTNVTAVGVFVGSGCAVPKVNNNNINFTASLAVSTPLSFAVTTDAKRNLIDPNSRMVGNFTWATTTASSVVSNTNVTSSSIITVTPTSATAGTIVAAKGYYITATTGGFTIFTGDATNTAASSTWNYEVI